MDDREKLVKQAISHFRHGVSHDICSEPVTTYAKLAIEALKKKIDKAPTVDAVPVVRCKGCKHAYINSFSAASGVALCTLLSKRTEGIQIVMKQDDFCSFGERKDGDD